MRVVAVALIQAFFLVVLAPAEATAQQTWSLPPIYVLTLRTDDADDQADALTQALRAQVRRAPGWSLADASRSFETLAIALRCPARPDAACLLRIADQLRAAHFIWGSLAKGPRGQVVAELHLWRRGKPEVKANAAYSDALKETGDPRLRPVAEALFHELTEPPSVGTLVVHAGSDGGTVFVDDVAVGSLTRGTARFAVDEGTHKVAVRVPGQHAGALDVTMVGSTERQVDFALEAEAGAPGEERQSGKSLLRPALGYAALGTGSVLLIAAVVETLNFANDKRSSEEDRANVPRSVADVCATPVNAAALDACSRSRDAKTASALGWSLGGAGAVGVAVGVWVLATENSSDHEAASRKEGRFEVVPRLGPREQSLSLRLTF